MKKLTLLVTTLAGIAMLGFAPSAKADWWWHHRGPYYHHYWGHHYWGPGVVVGAPFVFGPPVRVYYGGYYYTSHYHGSLAADVQVALRNRGYYGGPIDGDIGPGSRSAIRRFQIDQGIPVTGTMTRSLLVRLGL